MDSQHEEESKRQLCTLLLRTNSLFVRSNFLMLCLILTQTRFSASLRSLLCLLLYSSILRRSSYFSATSFPNQQSTTRTSARADNGSQLLYWRFSPDLRGQTRQRLSWRCFHRTLFPPQLQCWMCSWEKLCSIHSQSCKSSNPASWQ